jgi:TonB-dependent starch-binding outer membrane protein SusC
MRNRGVEFTISSNNITTIKDFSWSTDLNLFANRNKLLKLTDGFTRNVASQLFLGEPLSVIYDYHKIGIWQINEAQQAASFGNLPGDIKLEDLNKDGKIDANNDRKVLGSSQAKWQGGITNRFAYKNFDLSFVVYGRFGGLLISQVHQPFAGYLTTMDGRRSGVKVNYWTPSNPSNDFPSPNSINRTRPVGADWTTLGYYDASFVKMRSINIGYTLSRKLLNKAKVQSFRAYVTIQNPFVFYSPYMRAGGVDPEATGIGNQGVQSPDNISSRQLTIAPTTPPTRAFILGINATF